MTETTWHHKNSLSVKIMHSLKNTKPDPAPYFLASDNNWSKKNYCCDTTILLQMTLRAYSTYPLLCLDLLLGIVFDSCVSSVVLLMIGQLDQSLWWLQANGVASQVIKISSRFVPSDGLYSVDSCPNSEYFNRLVLVRTRPAGGFVPVPTFDDSWKPRKSLE